MAIKFLNTVAVDTDVLYVDASSNRVGIGTPSPSQKLEVNGAVLAGDYRGSTNVYLTSPDSWIFRSTGGNERMRITSAGNVGIGTTSPGKELDVVGTIRATDGSSQHQLRPTQLISYGTAAIINAESAGYDVRLNTQSSTVLIAKADGKVGIGTTSPTAPLTVKSNSVSSQSSGIVLQANGSTDDIIRMGEKSTNGGRLHMLDGGVEKIAFYTDGTDNHISAGNVGIGTTSPGYKLEVAGTARITSALTFGGNVNNIITGTASSLDFKSNGEYYFRKGANTNLTILSNGNVGIGTTNPGAKLEISHSGTNNGLLLENTLNSSNYQIALNIRENEGLIFQRWIAGAFNGNLMRIGYTGAIKFDAYDSTNNTGTPTYLLGTDASGNIVKTNTVPGSAAGPYLPLAGGTMTGTAGVLMPDNFKLKFGAAPDFEIYHNSTTNVNHISSLLGRQLSISSDTTIFSGDVLANANYTAGNSKIIYKAQRSGGAVAGDWSYDDATTDMSLGTSTAHSFSLKAGNTRALTINTSQNATFAGNVDAAGNVEARGYLQAFSTFYMRGTTQIMNKAANGFLNFLARDTSGPEAVMNISNVGTLSTSGNATFGGTISSGAITALAKGGQFGSTGYYVNSTFKDVNDNCGVILGHNDTANGVGVIAGVNELAFLTYGSAWTQALLLDSSQNATFAGDLYVPNKLIHVGDTNTWIQFETDVISLRTGGTDRLTLTNSNATFAGDVLVEDNLYLTDAGTVRGKIQLNSSDRDDLDIKAVSLGSNMKFFTVNTERMRIDSDGNVGIGTTSPNFKLQVNGGALAGGVVTYSKNYGSLDTTGNAVAGLTTSFNGASAGFTFTCFGHGGYQKVVYSCYNVSGTWNTKKVIDEGTNAFDVEASANATTITFTFKSTSGTKSYTPRVTVEATGSAINSTYA
jgi:hypothetical protein